MNRPTITPCPDLPPGFQAAATATGLLPNRDDLALLVRERPEPAAVVFTQSQLLGAHIPLCQEHLHKTGNLVRAILVNAGNANCATGAQGASDAKTMCRAMAKRLDCPTEEVLMISTGVIGAPLQTAPMVAALDTLVESLSPEGLEPFARAILTTDSHPKWATGGDGVVGVAKGSGMIHPDMATMLAFLLTSASGTPQGLATTLQTAVAESFHRLTIDGDTSPNDTVILWSGGGQHATPSQDQVITHTAVDLSRQIAGDGEGASRRVNLTVQGLPTTEDAVRVGRILATSPLVKTAIAGHDPNWGRLVAAAARSGVPMDTSKVDVSIGEHTVFLQGSPQPEAEPLAARHLRSEFDTQIRISFQEGLAEATVWSCDLTSEYVRINADYRS